VIQALLDLLESVLYGDKLVEDRQRVQSYAFRAALRGYVATGSVSFGNVMFSVMLPNREVVRSLRGPADLDTWERIEHLISDLPKRPKCNDPE